MFYFISTTLSTVGLGDFRPISDIERLEILPYMLFGYLIFSYIISEMKYVTNQLINSVATNEDLNGLNMFISTIRRLYNSNLPLMNNYEDKLQDFFHFYWANQRNLFLVTDEDKQNFSELPFELRMVILKDFCYPNFLKKFSRYF